MKKEKCLFHTFKKGEDKCMVCEEKRLNSEEVDKVFEDLVREKMNEKVFWKWVSSWYDADNIMDIILNWDEGEKRDTIEEFKHLIK